MSQSLFDKETSDSEAWHLQGNWGPVKEELTSSELYVKGKITEGLNGLYVRNGINTRDMIKTSGHSNPVTNLSYWVLIKA